jgi:hypothetical protein
LRNCIVPKLPEQFWGKLIREQLIAEQQTIMHAITYQIEWLRDNVVIEDGKLPASARTLSTAIQAAHILSIEIKARLPDKGPDSFRLKHESGQEIGVFPLPR